MSNSGWLREEADERLLGLFSERNEVVHRTILDLLEEAANDPELEGVLVETLEGSIRDQNDETMASAWIAIILGELGSADAIAPLIEGAVGDDETLAAAAQRALRRIGAPAFEVLIERLEEDDAIPEEAYSAIVKVLEGVALHELPHVRRRVLDQLLRTLETAGPGTSLVKLEAAALALARLGERCAIEPLRRVLGARRGAGDSFLDEALEILQEQPEGLPCSAAEPWQVEFRWALDGDLPAGEIGAAAEEDEERATYLEALKRRRRF